MGCFQRQDSLLKAICKDMFRAPLPMNHFWVNVSPSTALWNSYRTSEAPSLYFGTATIPKTKIQMEVSMTPLSQVVTLWTQLLTGTRSDHIQKCADWLLNCDHTSMTPVKRCGPTSICNCQVNLTLLLLATQPRKFFLRLLHTSVERIRYDRLSS